jgi:hypothetical protein
MKADTSITSLSSSMNYPMRYGYCMVGRVQSVGPLCSIKGYLRPIHRSHLVGHLCICLSSTVGTRVFSFQPHASCFVAHEKDLVGPVVVC